MFLWFAVDFIIRKEMVTDWHDKKKKTFLWESNDWRIPARNPMTEAVGLFVWEMQSISTRLFDNDRELLLMYVRSSPILSDVSSNCISSLCWERSSSGVSNFFFLAYLFFPFLSHMIVLSLELKWPPLRLLSWCHNSSIGGEGLDIVDDYLSECTITN